MIKIIKPLLLIILVCLLQACIAGAGGLAIEIPTREPVSKTKGTVFIDQINDKRKFVNGSNDRSEHSFMKSVSLGTLIHSGQTTVQARAIGMQYNGYGHAIASLNLPEDSSVEEEVRKLLKAGFSANGYTISDSREGALVVNTDIDRFWGWFQRSKGLQVSSELNVLMKIEKQEDTVQFYVKGEGLSESKWPSHKLWNKSFSNAYDSFLKRFEVAVNNLNL